MQEDQQLTGDGRTVSGTAKTGLRGRRRLRSSTVVLGSMGALAAVLSSCSSEPDKRCVDRSSHDYSGSYKIVRSQQCDSSGTGGTTARKAAANNSWKTGSSGRSGGSNPDWYYSSEVEGRRAASGTFSKAAAVERGGFGCDSSDSSSSSGGSYGG